jgi:hypothetical protein
MVRDPHANEAHQSERDQDKSAAPPARRTAGGHFLGRRFSAIGAIDASEYVHASALRALLIPAAALVSRGSSW